MANTSSVSIFISCYLLNLSMALKADDASQFYFLSERKFSQINVNESWKYCESVKGEGWQLIDQEDIGKMKILGIVFPKIPYIFINGGEGEVLYDLTTGEDAPYPIPTQFGSDFPAFCKNAKLVAANGPRTDDELVQDTIDELYGENMCDKLCTFGSSGYSQAHGFVCVNPLKWYRCVNNWEAAKSKTSISEYEKKCEKGLQGMRHSPEYGGTMKNKYKAAKEAKEFCGGNTGFKINRLSNNVAPKKWELLPIGKSDTNSVDGGCAKIGTGWSLFDGNAVNQLPPEYRQDIFVYTGYLAESCVSTVNLKTGKKSAQNMFSSPIQTLCHN